jgi:hypothetical protein
LGIPDLDIALAVTNVLAGIVLGLRYRVVIPVPAVSLVVTFAVIVGIARGDHFWLIILAMVIVGTAIQLGYLVGIAIRRDQMTRLLPMPKQQQPNGIARCDFQNVTADSGYRTSMLGRIARLFTHSFDFNATLGRGV